MPKQQIKTILISQPKPENQASPYYDLAKRKKLKIDFRQFIQVDRIESKEFRRQRIDLSEFEGVIFTSKLAVDFYFSMAESVRYTVSEETKYFCQTEAIALYLQKYVVYRKRKIFAAKEMFFKSLIPLLKKHKVSKFLLPSSDILKAEVPKILKAEKIKYKRAILYKTVSSDLSDLKDVKYDILVFFSPSGIKSLFDNFPDFVQGNTHIAAFGKNTIEAVKKAGLTCAIQAPNEKYKSMTTAFGEVYRR